MNKRTSPYIDRRQNNEDLGKFLQVKNHSALNQKLLSFFIAQVIWLRREQTSKNQKKGN
jgi:hypothetical protein